VGTVHADLRIGPDLTRALALRANEGLCSPGVKLHGAGFIVTPVQAKALGLGRVPRLEQHIRPYRNGRDLTARSRNVMVIDLFALKEAEVRQRFADVYLWVLERVKPEREHNNRASYRDIWWVFGEPRREIRPALIGLERFVVTVVTAKHRLFLFVDGEVLPDDALVAIALSDAYYLGVLSSRIHVAWAQSAGGTLEDRERYNKSRCFDPFPFPDCSERERATIAALAEELDALRKERLRLHPDLTLTALYNVLVKLRSAEPLEQFKAVRAALAAHGTPARAEQVAARFVRVRRDRIGEVLETLVSLGQARQAGRGLYAA
jgi:hypothetical protein